MWLWRRVNSILAKTMSLGFWGENAAVDSRASGVALAERAAADKRAEIKSRGLNSASVVTQKINHLLCAILWHCPLSVGVINWAPRGPYRDIYVAHERRILVSGKDEPFSQKPEFTVSDVIKSRWQPCQERNHYTTVSWRRRFYFKNYSQPRSIFQLLRNSNSWYYYCTLVASERGNIPSHCCLGLCDCESWMFQICDKLSSFPNERFDHFECQLLMVLDC